MASPQGGSATAVALAASLLPGTPVCLAHVRSEALCGARGVVARAAAGAEPLAAGNVHVLLLSPPSAVAAHPAGVSVAAHKLAVEGPLDPALLPGPAQAAAPPQRQVHFAPVQPAEAREAREGAAARVAEPWFPPESDSLADALAAAMHAGASAQPGCAPSLAACATVLSRGAAGDAGAMHAAATLLLLHARSDDKLDEAAVAAALACFATTLPELQARDDLKLTLTLLEALSLLLRGGAGRKHKAGRVRAAVEAGVPRALVTCCLRRGLGVAHLSALCVLFTDFILSRDADVAGGQPYRAMSAALDAGLLEAMVPLLDPTVEPGEDVETLVRGVLLILSAMLARGDDDALRRAAAAALLPALRRLLARLPSAAEAVSSVGSIMMELTQNGTRTDALRELTEADLRRLLAAAAAAPNVARAETIIRTVTAAVNFAPLRPVAASLGALEAGVAFMRRHPGVAGAQAAGCSLLGNVVAGCVPNKQGAAKAGAMAAVLDAAAAHGRDVKVATAAALCIENLAANCHANAAAVGPAGVAALLGLLREHGDDEHVATHAMFAACNVCTAGGESEGDTNSPQEEAKFAAWIAGGGYALVVRAMERFPLVLVVQEAGVALMYRFAINASVPLRDACLDAGAVPAVLSAMATFMRDPARDATSMISAGCRFLARMFAPALASGSAAERHVERACAAGAPRTLVAAMKHFQAAGDEACVAHAADALVGLTRDDRAPFATLPAMNAAGVLDAAAAGLRAMPANHEAYATQANIVTVMLQRQPELQATVCASGIIEALVAGVACRTGAGVVAKHAGWTAVTVASSYHKSKEAMCRAVCAGVLEALEADGRSAAPCTSAFGGAANRASFIACMAAVAVDHDEHATGAHAACARCEAMRVDGRMCGARSCGARVRRAEEGAAAKTRKLPRCAGCGRRAYCCLAHQRDDWGRHKAACKAAQAAG